MTRGPRSTPSAGVGAGRSTTVIPAAPGTITHTLSVGSPYRNEVRTLQARLDKLGSSLVVDGSFGARTRQAVTTFQASHGLVRDGVVGPLTGRALGLR